MCIRDRWPDSPGGTTIHEQTEIHELIAYIYEWGISLGVIASFIALVIAGVKYMTCLLYTSLADDFCTKDWSNENKVVFYQDNISDITSDKYDKGSAPSPDDHKKAKAGLVPCGKRFDDPNTPWDRCV